MQIKIDIKKFLTQSKITAESSIVSYLFSQKRILFDEYLNILNNLNLNYFYVNNPTENIELLGIDSFISFNGKEVDFKKIKSEFFTNLTVENKKRIPLFLGGLKFQGNSKSNSWNDFKNSEWFIPRILFVSMNGEHFSLFNFNPNDKGTYDKSKIKLLEKFLSTTNGTGKIERIKLDIKTDVNKAKKNWRKNISEALNAIRKGQVSKIVLSRFIQTELNDELNVFHIKKILTQNYPKCYTFFYKKQGSLFFGSTPEKLIKISSRKVYADALAGSIKRGEDNIEDEKLSEELLSSNKNLIEQRAVVDFILSTLENYSTEITYASKPKIKKLENIQHLWTQITATLLPEADILEIVNQLHPTPAVCGTPCKIASELISSIEKYDRGMYAGVLGWFNLEQEGEFIVGIRSALERDRNLKIYSGCGIVEGSDFESEFLESELKMNPIKMLFEYEN